MTGVLEQARAVAEGHAAPRDPILHTHVEDGLPEEHPLAFTTVRCLSCQEMVHGATNECLETWVETGRGPRCLRCFSLDAGRAVEPSWGLA